MNTPILTIMIPNYNQENLVYKALDSIPKRNDIEIIIIDDYSSDNSLNIIKDWVNKNKLLFYNIILRINKVNKGCGFCKNWAYSVAHGKYIITLDSDDYLYTDNYNKLINKLYSTEFDIIPVSNSINNGKIWSENKSKGPFVWRCATWSYFCKNSFLKKNNLNYNKEARRAGDLELSRKILDCKPSWDVWNTLAYHYNYPREGSIVWNYDHGLIDKIGNKKIKVNYYCQWDIPNKPKHWEWVKGENTVFDAYIDLGCYKVKNDGKKKIALLREPAGLFQEVHDWIRADDHWKLFDYIFTTDYTLFDLPNVRQNIIGGVWYVTQINPLDKDKLISFCCSTKRMIQSHKDRQKLVDKLYGNHKIDFFGGYRSPRATTKEIYERYKFNIVFEPEHNEYHFSEKILNCFSNKCIPINYGCTNLEKWGFDTSGVIQISDPQEIIDLVNSNFDFDKFYKEHIDAIEHNYKNCIQYSFYEDWLLATYPDIFDYLCKK